MQNESANLYDAYPDELSPNIVKLHLEPDAYDLVESSI